MIAKRVSPQFVLECVCAHCGVTLEELVGDARPRQAVYARSYCVYLLRSMTHLSLESVGELLGGRDHTTIMSAYTRITERMATDQELARDVAGLRREVTRSWTLLQGGEVPKLETVLEVDATMPTVSADAVMDLLDLLERHRGLLPAMQAAARQWKSTPAALEVA